MSEFRTNGKGARIFGRACGYVVLAIFVVFAAYLMALLFSTI